MLTTSKTNKWTVCECMRSGLMHGYFYACVCVCVHARVCVHLSVYVYVCVCQGVWDRWSPVTVSPWR